MHTPLARVKAPKSDDTRDRLLQAAAEIFAKLKARMARLPGEVVEAFAMDKERASKVQERMLGKIRSAHEADELLDRME